MLILALLVMQASAAPDETPPAPPAIVTTASGLRFQVLRAGTGRRPEAGDAVQVTYETRLADGTVVDSTPQPVGLLVTGLIPGFTEALLMMNQGGQYRFRVPPALGYGAQGLRDLVPPDAELDFTLSLIRVGRAAAPPPPR